MFRFLGSDKKPLSQKEIDLTILDCPVCVESHHYTLRRDDYPSLFKGKERETEIYLSCPREGQSYKARIRVGMEEKH